MDGFSTLYTQYFNKAVRFTTSYIHDEAIAEDIASEVLFALWRKMKEQNVLNEQALLRTMLKNKALDYLRHQNTKNTVAEHLASAYQAEVDFRIQTLEATDPETVLTDELYQMIIQAVETLPKQTQDVFLMSRFEYRSNRDIGQKLDISTKTVEYHITKALKVLRVQLKDYLPVIAFYLGSRWL